METGETRRRIRVLWITHDFPPRVSSGMYRPVKIWKYLDRSRFDVEFLTGGGSGSAQSGDDSLLRDLPERPTVHRVPDIVPDEYIGKVRAMFRMRRTPALSMSLPEGAATPKSRPPGILRKAYRWMVMAAYFPDQYVLWGLFASVAALRLSRRKAFDIVYTTSHPPSGHLPGFLLKRRGNIKWVADFRDGGILWDRCLLGIPRPRFREGIDFRYQERVLRSADLVITHSELLRESFEDRFGIDIRKTVSISNGYDEADFRDATPLERLLPPEEGVIRVLHLGTWYLPDDEIKRLVRRLSALDESLVRMGFRIALHAVGRDILGKHRQAARFAYAVHGPVAHDAVAGLLRAADAFLLTNAVDGEVRGWLPGKLWEYLYEGKPILYYGNRDEAWSIVERSGAGIAIDPGEGDPEAAAKLVRGIIGGGTRRPPPRFCSWRARARSVEDAFTAILDASGNPSAPLMSR